MAKIKQTKITKKEKMKQRKRMRGVRTKNYEAFL
jgi:hypothetical protein